MIVWLVDNSEVAVGGCKVLFAVEPLVFEGSERRVSADGEGSVQLRAAHGVNVAIVVRFGAVDAGG